MDLQGTIKSGRNGWRSLLMALTVIGSASAASAGYEDAAEAMRLATQIPMHYTPAAFPISLANLVRQNSPALISAASKGWIFVSAMAASAQAVDPIQTSGVPASFFGTVAIPFAAINVRGQWERVRAQNLPAPGSCASKSCKIRVSAFQEAVNRGKKMDFAGKLMIANNIANSLIAYQSDRATYGSFDHWASAGETIQRGAGDCEDYAILKQSLLRAMGVPDRSLSIIVLRDNSRNLYHAVLGISTNQGHLILDNVRGNVFRDTQASNYQPLFSFSGTRSWIHGKPADKSTLTAKAHAAFDKVAPGESAAAPLITAASQPLIMSELRPSLQ